MSMIRIGRSASVVAFVVVFALITHSVGADIFQWEYIDPADPSQGRRESNVLLTTKDAVPNANLRNTSLRKAYLVGANLNGAVFNELYIDFGLIIPAANLTEADLSGADLTNAVFNLAPLTGAYLTDAAITGASFSGTTLTYQQLASTSSFKSGNLAGIALGVNSMDGWVLSGQDMTGATFNFSSLVNANFSNSTLVSANLSNTNLTGANLSHADLTGVKLRASDMTNADFTGANLSGVWFDEGVLTGADITDTTIINARFLVGAAITPQQLMSTASYKLGDLSGVAIAGYSPNGTVQDLSGIDFSGHNLTGAKLWAVLDGADLSGSNMTDADLRFASLIGADLTDALIKGGTFSTLTTPQLTSTASFKTGDLAGTNFISADLSGLDMSGFDLSSVFGHSADLSGSDLSGADLTDTYLYQATLSGADLTDAIINGASIIRNTGLTEQQIASTASFKAGDLSRVQLSYNDLSGWDLSGLNLTGGALGILGSQIAVIGPTTDLMNTDLSGSNLTDVDFIRADLNNTDFTDAIITGANFRRAVNLTSAQLMSTASYKAGDLSGISFQELDISGWDLSGLTLSDVEFEGAVLVGTNLSGSDLTYAHFRSTNLSNADLRGADLTHAFIDGYQLNLNGANLRGTDMRGAIGLPFNDINNAADSHNLILPNGWMVNGLTVQSSELVLIRDYLDTDGVAGLRISIQDFFDIDTDGTLRMVFEDSDWGSTIRFDASVVTAYLGGTLELGLNLTDGLAVEDLIGSTFQLFDWTGVSTVGTFDAVALDPAWYEAGLSLDLSQLMATGSVRVVPLIGDLDGDGFVGINDLMVVQLHWNEAVTPGNLLAGDINGDGFVGVDDLNGVLSTWNAAVPPPASESETAIPEPMTGVLIAAGVVCLLRRKHGRLS